MKGKTIVNCITKKRVKNKHKTVKEYVVEYYRKSLDEISFFNQTKEIDTGKPVGEEIW